MLAVLTIQHLTEQQLYGHLPSVLQDIQERHVGHC